MDKATRVVGFFLSVLALLQPIDSMTSTLSFARNLMSFWNVPETGSLNVALYLPSWHALASVDKHLRHLVGWAKRDIIDDFLCSDFDVHCLGDFVANEFSGRPMLDKLCRLHFGQPSEGIDKEVLF